jgi:hypothetical protein
MFAQRRAALGSCTLLFSAAYANADRGHEPTPETTDIDNMADDPFADLLGNAANQPADAAALPVAVAHAVRARRDTGTRSRHARFKRARPDIEHRMWSFFTRLSALMAKYYKDQPDGPGREPVYFTYNGQLYRAAQDAQIEGHARGVYSRKVVLTPGQLEFAEEFEGTCRDLVEAAEEARQNAVIGAAAAAAAVDDAAVATASRTAALNTLPVALRNVSMQAPQPNNVGELVMKLVTHLASQGNRTADEAQDLCDNNLAYLRAQSYTRYLRHPYLAGRIATDDRDAIAGFQDAHKVPYDLFNFDYRRMDLMDDAEDIAKRNHYDRNSCTNYMPQAECLNYDKTKFCQVEAKLAAFFGTPAVKDYSGDVVQGFQAPTGDILISQSCIRDIDIADAQVVQRAHTQRTIERGEIKRTARMQRTVLADVLGPHPLTGHDVDFDRPDRRQVRYNEQYRQLRHGMDPNFDWQQPFGAGAARKQASASDTIKLGHDGRVRRSSGRRTGGASQDHKQTRGQRSRSRGKHLLQGARGKHSAPKARGKHPAPKARGKPLMPFAGGTRLSAQARGKVQVARPRSVTPAPRRRSVGQRVQARGQQVQVRGQRSSVQRVQVRRQRSLIQQARTRRSADQARRPLKKK